jgi:hypothetical protein
MSKQNENPELELPEQTLGKGGDDAVVDASRRKFAGAGLGVSAIFTLASRPVLAGACRSPSGHESGNTSQHGAIVLCTGKSPSHWSAFGSGDPILDKKFHDVFLKSKNIIDYDEEAGTEADFGGKAKMKEVMAKFGESRDKKPQPLGAEFAAAWVNINKGFIPNTVLNETRLNDMWDELIGQGTYTPMTGATPWTANDVILYLRSLQG